MVHCSIFNVYTAGFVFETVLTLFGTTNMTDTSKVVKILPVVELKSFQMGAYKSRSRNFPEESRILKLASRSFSFLRAGHMYLTFCLHLIETFSFQFTFLILSKIKFNERDYFQDVPYMINGGKAECHFYSLHTLLVHDVKILFLDMFISIYLPRWTS